MNIFSLTLSYEQINIEVELLSPYFIHLVEIIRKLEKNLFPFPAKCVRIAR